MLWQFYSSRLPDELPTSLVLSASLTLVCSMFRSSVYDNINSIFFLSATLPHARPTFPIKENILTWKKPESGTFKFVDAGIILLLLLHAQHVFLLIRLERHFIYKMFMLHLIFVRTAFFSYNIMSFFPE